VCMHLLASDEVPSLALRGGGDVSAASGDKPTPQPGRAFLNLLSTSITHTLLEICVVQMGICIEKWFRLIFSSYRGSAVRHKHKLAQEQI